MVIIHDDIILVFPKIAQETSIFHIRHDNGWSTSNAHTHTNQGHHIGMVKVFHLQNFICHVVYIIYCEKTCPNQKPQSEHNNYSCHELIINEPHLPEEASLDVMQCHPVRRSYDTRPHQLRWGDRGKGNCSLIQEKHSGGSPYPYSR